MDDWAAQMFVSTETPLSVLVTAEEPGARGGAGGGARRYF